MLNSNSLSAQLPLFLDAIAHQQPVRLKALSDEETVAFIPCLLPHKLEYLAFLSLTETSSLEDFYITTWQQQFQQIVTRLQSALISCEAVFLQGFPRVMEHHHILSPGMRTDIDIFVPSHHKDAFRVACQQQGFDHYGFDDESLFLVDDDTLNAFSADYWAGKDFSLTLPFKCALPEDLPIDFGDCYLPWLNRQRQWHLLVAVELHHSYTDSADGRLISNGAESWPDTAFKRCNLATLLYFNLVRLYKGVLAGEKRLRLLLDTACLFTDKALSSALPDIDRLLEGSPLNAALRELCQTLTEMHPLFMPLSNLCHTHNTSALKEQWRTAFMSSLQITPVMD